MSISAAISSLSSRYPKPTNAVALAATTAIWQPVDRDAGKALGLSEYVADAFAMPRGVLPRMRLLAGGWVRPGDKFKETDAAWWGQPYAYALWNPLATWAAFVEKAGIGAGWSWDDELAAGNASAVSRALALANDDLTTIKRLGYDKCAPWIIPTAKGAMPLPNPICPPPETDKFADPIKEARKATPDFPWWLVALIAVVVVGKRKR